MARRPRAGNSVAEHSGQGVLTAAHHRVLERGICIQLYTDDPESRFVPGAVLLQ